MSRYNNSKNATRPTETPINFEDVKYTEIKFDTVKRAFSKGDTTYSNLLFNNSLYVILPETRAFAPNYQMPFGVKRNPENPKENAIGLQFQYFFPEEYTDKLIAFFDKLLELACDYTDKEMKKKFFKKECTYNCINNFIHNCGIDSSKESKIPMPIRALYSMANQSEGGTASFIKPYKARQKKKDFKTGKTLDVEDETKPYFLNLKLKTFKNEQGEIVLGRGSTFIQGPGGKPDTTGVKYMGRLCTITPVVKIELYWGSHGDTSYGASFRFIVVAMNIAPVSKSEGTSSYASLLPPNEAKDESSDDSDKEEDEEFIDPLSSVKSSSSSFQDVLEETNKEPEETPVVSSIKNVEDSTNEDEEVIEMKPKASKKKKSSKSNK